jgi:hypothetical protein
LCNASGDIVDIAESIDLDHKAALFIDCDERSRLALVERLAVTDGVFRVVGATFFVGALQ